MQKCMECCVLNEMGVLGNDRLLFFFFFKLFLTFSKMMCHNEWFSNNTWVGGKKMPDRACHSATREKSNENKKK